MTLRLKIEWLEDGRIATHMVDPMQSVILGSSYASDIRLADPTDLAARHCEISLDSSGCTVQDLTRGQLPLTVSDDPVQGPVELYDGDVVLVGYNEVRIRLTDAGAAVTRQRDSSPSACDSDSVLAAAAGTAAGATLAANAANSQVANGLVADIPPQPAPDTGKPQDPPSAGEFERFDNGLWAATFQQKEAADFLKLLAGGAKPGFLLTNHKAMGQEIPPDQGPNRLVEGDQQVLAENSLAVIGPLAPPDLLKALEAHAATDAILALFPRIAEVDLDDFCAELNSLWIWLTRPSKFHFHMQHGIEFLIKRAFGPILSAAYYLPESNSRVLLGSEPEITAISDLQK